MGDRKYQFKSKGYYYDYGNNLFSEMCFEDNSGIFSSNKWKYRDQVEAEILTVKTDFMNKFLGDYPGKKHSPGKKDIVERHGKMEGRWCLDIMMDGEVVYNVEKNIPFASVPYPYPLSSNTNYREDIYYRKIGDDSRSQNEKERLEEVQRADRKWRTKLTGKKH